MVNGVTYDVKFDLAGNGANPLNAGGFSIWTSGVNPLETSIFDSVGFHTYNQVRGANDNGNIRNFALSGAYGNIIDGHDGWVGYAQNGVTFTNGDGDVVANGGAANLSSEVVSGYSVDVSTSASLNLLDLASGYYLIGLGGACPDGLDSCNPTLTGETAFRDYTFTVSAVPVPAAIWLFGSAIAGLGFSSRRKLTA